MGAQPDFLKAGQSGGVKGPREPVRPMSLTSNGGLHPLREAEQSKGEPTQGVEEDSSLSQEDDGTAKEEPVAAEGRREESEEPGGEEVQC